MILHKKSLKLASLYLAVMMLISLVFSLAIYQLSTQELARGLRRSPEARMSARLPEASFPNDVRQALESSRAEQYEEAQSRVLNRLVAINIVILFGAGLLSYFLAVRTLRPIEEAHEALERFTADVSHELRTPIAVMQSEIEVALMDKLSLPEAKKILSSNLEELGKLTALTEGLLKLARQDTAHISQTELSLKTVIEDAMSRIKPEAQAKGIKFKLSLGEDAKVRGDKSSLTEAVMNILDNAVKYSPSKSSVDVVMVKKHRSVLIGITDRGIGIDSKDLGLIFNRFYRADSARSNSNIDGYGIGLALASQIVALHDGSLDASSVLGEGSTFTIRLPIA